MLDTMVLIFSLIGMAILGATVVLRNRTNGTYLLFGLVLLSSSLWSLALYLTNHIQGDSAQLLINRLSLFIGFLVIVVLWLVSVFFPYRLRKHRAQTAVIVFFAASLFLVGLFTAGIVKEVVYRPEREITDIITGDFYLLYIVGAFLALGFLTTNFIRSYRSEKLNLIQKKQILLVAFGFFLAFLWAMLTAAIIPSITGNWEISKFGAVGTWFIIGSMIYAIYKHKLFDIRLILARSLAYLLALGLLTIVTASVIFFVGGFLENEGVSTSIVRWFLVYVTLTMALAYQPLKKRFDKITNTVFFRDAYDTKDLLDEFNKKIVTTIEITDLTKRTSQVLSKYLKSEYVSFALIKDDGALKLLKNSEGNISKELVEQIRGYIRKSESKMTVTDRLDDPNHDLALLLTQENIGLIARITDNVQKEGVGYVILGQKKTGSTYTSQDISAMQIILNELAIAAQNALSYEEIQQFNVTLQDKVDDATKQLRKANERLKQLDQTKDDFISMASHQLRTPLTSVKGYVSMVIEGDAGKISTKQKDLLDQAFLSSQRMVYLIADLLNVSRLRTGKFVVEAKPTNLAEVIEGEIKQLEQTAKAKEQKLTYNKPKKFPTLMFDETKMRQVIMNFADNAVHYVPNGGKIDISLQDLGDSIEFKVVDNGIGVPSAEQHHLFNKFYRAKNAKKARPDGTGLGLFMAKKVVAAQGGAILFNSTEGKGSTFGFTFAKKKVDPSSYKPDIKH